MPAQEESMALFKSAMHYLGLGPDDEYDDYDQVDDRAPQAPPVTRSAVPTRDTSPVTARPAPSAGRPRSVPPSQPPTADLHEQSAVRPLPSPSGVDRPKPQSVVRPVPAFASAKPHVVAPSSFNQAQDVADKFKNSQPVILNLQGVDRDLSRRLIDFSSGMCYGLGGQMEKVAHQVYLLTPANVEVSPDERRRLSERGLHDA
jgi:cell division inhibitor SepF